MKKITKENILTDLNGYNATVNNGYNVQATNACVRNCLATNMLPTDLVKAMYNDITSHNYYKLLKAQKLVKTVRIGLYIYVMYKSNDITAKQLQSLYQLVKLNNRYFMSFKKPCKVIDNERIKKLNIRKYDMFYLVTPCYFYTGDDYTRVHNMQQIKTLYTV